MYDELSDDQLREYLKEIDDDEDVDVSTFEAKFIDTVCFKYAGPLSKKQREVAIQMLEKYLR